MGSIIHARRPATPARSAAGELDSTGPARSATREVDSATPEPTPPTSSDPSLPPDLDQPDAPPPPPPTARERLWLGSYRLVLLGLAGLRFALRLDAFAFLGRYGAAAERLTITAMAAVLALAAGKAIQLYVVGRLRDPVSRYSLTRLVRLAVGLVIGFLDTTLWGFGGEHLSSDHPSGRLIKFPNSRIFDTPVYNDS